jgi:hypothetical protein
MLARINVQYRPARRLWYWIHSWAHSDGNRLATARHSRCDRRLADGEEPPLGAHLVTPRFAFVHHGIYLGDGKVMHCGALSRMLPRGPVEEASLWHFSRGRPIAVRRGEVTRFSAQAVVERARSRAGENRYSLFTNNCEHFCEWCLRGQHRSYQVERLIRWIRPRGIISADDQGALG